MRYVRPALIALAGLCSLSLYSCATRGEIEYAGFLSSYEDLEPAPHKKGALAWHSEDADLGRYNRLIIEPIEVFYHPDADYKGIRPSQLATLSDTLYLAFSKAMMDRYPLTEQPGPNTIRMRAALVNVRANSSRGTAMSTMSGERRLSGDNGILVTANGLNMFVKEVGIEAEFFDSVTGERLFAFVDKEVSGTHLGDNFQDWGVVKHAFKDWAVGLRAAFDRAHR